MAVAGAGGSRKAARSRSRRRSRSKERSTAPKPRGRRKLFRSFDFISPITDDDLERLHQEEIERHKAHVALIGGKHPFAVAPPRRKMRWETGFVNMAEEGARTPSRRAASTSNLRANPRRSNRPTWRCANPSPKGLHFGLFGPTLFMPAVDTDALRSQETRRQRKRAAAPTVQPWHTAVTKLGGRAPLLMATGQSLTRDQIREERRQLRVLLETSPRPKPFVVTPLKQPFLGTG
ncbi:hypothetical protein PBRA_008113 [Plasmodiophora brassicae]|uniref:Uncharacterized protein n=1 Tax=Plasmodiophora brassicae TaxID=37360 RepID=A0A0G4J0I5_PLABS|nr:hypothetical protein PBRA_008113 [Plasmodiophora brassicae]